MMMDRKGNSRVTGKEQYYTPPERAEYLTSVMASLVPRYHKRIWLEPAAGTGSFVNAIAKYVPENRILACDIEPLRSGVQRCDFLQKQLVGSGWVCLTNPPFGRNNSLSVKFFNHAASACDFVGFIVPRSWRKWSVQDRLNPAFHLIHDEDLQINYVDADGNPLANGGVSLQTCFQVWQRRREYRDKVHVPDYGFVTKTTPELADVAIRVFGYGCGQVHTDFPRVPNTTMMFLKVSGPEIITALQACDFNQFSSKVAYTPALSITEIRYCLNERLFAHI